MVKAIKVYIDPLQLLEHIKSTTEFSNCRDFIVTDVRVDCNDTIEFKMIISDEIIDKKESVRYRYE